MTCPVVNAINEIRGSGLYKNDSEDSTDGVIKIGGTDSEVEYVCDDTTFYMMTRKMELARFELGRPNLSACKSKYSRVYKDLAGIDYATLYTRLINTALKERFIYTQFVDLVNLIADMEETIVARVDAAGRAGQPINISIPDIILLPHVDKLIVYRVDILHETVNKIIDYVNKINVNSLIKDRIDMIIPRVEKFTSKIPDMKTKIPQPQPQSVDEYITAMKELLNYEMIMAEYVREVEKYQCGVINHLNLVYDVCKKIITGLLQY